MGLLVSSSQNTAFNTHAFWQFLHPMHFFESNFTPNPSRDSSAPVGQTAAHGGFLHARHTSTVKPDSKPATEWILIALLEVPATPNLREHANMHDWQPTQRSTSTTDNLFGMSTISSHRL